MSSDTEFTIGERKFVVKPLKLMQQMQGWSILSNVLIPAFIGMSTGSGLAESIGAIDRLPELYAMFAEVAEVEWQPGKMMPLKAFGEEVFKRRSDLLLAFLGQCVIQEYGCFLDEGGRAVLMATASRLRSLLASSGMFGELLPTAE